MPKIDKLLVLLELLYNRRVVPMSVITQECRIVERTAYRYIGTLQDANFPIEYDQELGGYTLIGKGTAITAQFTDPEMVVLYFGTLLLEQYAKDSVLDSIKSSRVKLESRISHKLQQVLGQGREALISSTSPAAPQEIVAMSTLLLAALKGQPISVTYLGSDGASAREQIVSPKIIYDREWVLGAADLIHSRVQIPIRQIQRIDLDALPA